MRSSLLIALLLTACGSTDDGSGTPDDAAPPEDTAVADTTLADTAADTATGTDAFDAPATETSVDAGRDFSSDRTKFFGDSRCATAGVQLCEDFESGTLDVATWSVVGDKPTVDGLQHARGKKALHITKTGNGNSYIKETKTFPAEKNRYWGRIFVYFDKLPAPPMTYAHWTFAAASGTGTKGEIRLSGQLSSGLNHFGVGTDSSIDPTGTGDWTNSDKDPSGMPKPVPTKEWACIEWLHDGENNETRFFWDGVEHPSLHTTSTMHGGNTNPYILPTFTNVWIGWAEYQTTTEPFEMWVDEIAIDKERIGCAL